MATSAQHKQTPAPLPRFVRAPVRGPEYFSTFSRSKLYQLEKSGSIRAIQIKDPGKGRGVKLFDLRSILSYIEKQASSK